MLGTTNRAISSEQLALWRHPPCLWEVPPLRICQSTRFNRPEDLNLHERRYQNLTSRRLHFVLYFHCHFTLRLWRPTQYISWHPAGCLAFVCAPHISMSSASLYTALAVRADGDFTTQFVWLQDNHNHKHHHQH